VTIHVENRGKRRVRLREENLRLVGAHGSTHEVVRTQTADAGQPGWTEQILEPGARFDAKVWFDEVNPLGDQPIFMDAFYTDVETGERGPELAVPVKTRPDAVAADRTDAGGSTTQ
jgi:homoserine acetyltransferase